MRSGSEFWLDPQSNTLHPTSSPTEWMLMPSNRNVIPLTPLDREYISTLDLNADADEICSLGQRRGLVWIRTDSECVTICYWLQFSEEQRLPGILAAIARVLPQIADDQSKTITLFNTSGGCEANAVISVAGFLRKEAAKEPIMQDREPDENCVKNLRFDPTFNRRVDELLGG